MDRDDRLIERANRARLRLALLGWGGALAIVLGGLTYERYTGPLGDIGRK